MYWIQCIENGPRRVNHAAGVLKHLIYSFGGYSNTEDYSRVTPIDIHIFNTRTLKWSPLAKPRVDEVQYTRTPYSRYGHTVVVYREKFYLWGGRNDHSGACNRLFSFDPETRQWSIVSIAGQLIPSARDGHSACLIEDRMYIFGGFEDDNQQFSNDLYYFDFIDSSWHYHRLKIGEDVPQWRDFHSATNLNNRMYVFGGRFDRIGPLQTAQNIYDDRLYAFDPPNQSWTLINTQGQAPCGRRSHSAFVHDDKLYIFGGFNNDLNRHFNDLYEFAPLSCVWRRVFPHGLSSPIPRRRQCCLVIEHQMFLFGGTSPVQTTTGQDLFNETEELNGFRTRLFDQNDLHVLDFRVSLKTLCFLRLADRQVPIEDLPRRFHSDYQIFFQSTFTRQRSNGQIKG